MLIAAILEELGYFDEKKEKDKTQEGHHEGFINDSSLNSGEEEEK